MSLLFNHYFCSSILSIETTIISSPQCSGYRCTDFSRIQIKTLKIRRNKWTSDTEITFSLNLNFHFRLDSWSVRSLAQLRVFTKLLIFYFFPYLFHFHQMDCPSASSLQICLQPNRGRINFFSNKTMTVRIACHAIGILRTLVYLFLFCIM